MAAMDPPAGANLRAAGGFSASDDAPIHPPSIGERLRSPRTALSLALAIVLVLVVFGRMNIDLGSVWRAIRNANPWLLLAAFAAYYAAFPVRAVRWRLLLRNAHVTGARGQDIPSVPALTNIVLLSWFANCVAPAKLGDAYRGYLLKRDMGASFTQVMGTIVAERLLDLIALAGVMTASGFIVFGGAAPRELRWMFGIGAVLALGAISGIAVLMRAEGLLRRVAPQRAWPHVERLRHGIVGSFSRAQLPMMAGLTCIIWTLEGLRVLGVALALGIDLSIAGSFFVALLASLLTAVPITPAGLGAVESGAIVALKLLDIGGTQAAALALIDRGIAYWSVILIGGSAWLVGRRAAARRRRRVAPALG